MEETGSRTDPAGPGEIVHAVSPGRINLIGEHVDYLGGDVVPVAIDRHIAVEAQSIGGEACEVVARLGSEERRARIDYSDLEPRRSDGESWVNYLVGVLALTREGGGKFPGLRVTVESDLPVGAGLSSSAALETAFSLVVDSFAGIERSVLDRARICREAEHRFAGVPCGIMDQLAVGAGRTDAALRIDCDREEWAPVDLPARWSLLIADSGVTHSLADGEYRKRRQQCDEILDRLGRDGFRDLSTDEIEANRGRLGDLLFRRARHVVTEMARVDRFCAALEDEDAAAVGAILRAGHDSLRDDYEVSCTELDALVDAAYAFGPDRGLVGARMTGGGFGGSVIALVREEAAAALEEHLRNFYRESLGRDLDCFVTKAVSGASVGPARIPQPLS